MRFRTWALSAVLLIAVRAAGAAQPAKLPDLQGVWENISGIHMDRFTRGFDGDPVGRAAFKPVDPPYNAEYAARYATVTAAHARGEPINDPTATCLWPGFPRIILAPYPIEIVYADGGKRVVMIHEYMSQVRRLYADGRKHPQDLEASYNGHTIAHWEGQTLVTDTVGLRADTMLQNTGMMHSDAMRVQERWQLKEPDLLEDEVTIIDPKAFTKPYVTHRLFRRHRDWSIADYVCEENNRERTVNGVTRQVMPGK
jgi:hypothetical protein